MVIPVGSMALAIPFHDLVMQKSCRALRGRRGSVSGGVGGSVRGGGATSSASPFFCMADRAFPKLPPMGSSQCVRLSTAGLSDRRRFESMRRGRGATQCAGATEDLNEKNRRER
ncbi:hypothetical protein AVEN_264228-1 [Araneus ventricosus]|uniref:Uncharacterized protein n=1 Tax=Araneus ventricosus TaxID=182803 RepID=A0A4Y2J241_ARAVE|nr:hypothetical protein AVEN_264228-1 [Araneus ventricosus]